MALSSFGASLRSFWHTLTSADRHASHDSPYRTGQHVPLNQSKHHAPLTSIATSALDSRTDLSGGGGGGGALPSPYADDTPRSGTARSSSFPYSPGMRSSEAQRTASPDPTQPPPAAAQQQHPNDDHAPMSPGEIQMQNFHDGRPPAPPVQHSWRRIDGWADSNYPELRDQLADACTANDLQELEHELDVSLPVEVRESLQCHDGQERGGRPTGILFGCMLLDCEEIVQEWRQWRTVNEDFLMRPPSSSSSAAGRVPKAFAGSSAAPPSSARNNNGSNSLWRQELLARQASHPPRHVRPAYFHPGWIPLARDWGGNNIAVDLAPGPQGRWGQVIVFGRDFDRKYVVARGWAAFLAGVADDLRGEKAVVDDESGELRLKEFRQESVDPTFLEILRWRMDEKYGRPRPLPGSGHGGAGANGNLLPPSTGGPQKKRAPNGIHSRSPRGSPRGSPYGSPTDERGRSPSRPASLAPTRSATLGAPITPSPLSSQLSDETVQGGDTPPSAAPATGAVTLGAPTPRRPTLETNIIPEAPKQEKLVEAPTPTLESDPGPARTLSGGGKENEVKGLGVDGLEEMKNVAI